ncbi:hypothetical protein ACQWU4_03620 [Chryseobacterium sp. MIQD13]|uniref:hypothetical protein n=1 Tax=Chryseobacterium sp. MIQD13 TaxID=3422310 RepID=UPI003D2DAD49
MKNKLLLLGIILAGQKSLAQLGINTANPQGIFNVDGGKDNATSGSSSTSQQINDFIVNANGNTGIGTHSPVVKLDMRTSSGNSAMAIGSTSQSASSAKAGAIRYASVSGGKIQYSDGTIWYEVQAAPTKVFIKADNTSGFTLAPQSSAIPTNWTESYDTTNSFNAATGTFTAPRAGNFMLNASYCFDVGTTKVDTGIEIQVVVSNTSGTKRYKFRKEAGGAGNNYVAITGSITMNLQKNDIVQAYPYNGTDTYTKSLIVNPGYNILSITEL